MNRDEFLTKVNQQSQSRTYDDELIPVMKELPEYYENLASQVNKGKMDNMLVHSGDTFEYQVQLANKALKFIRTEDSIEVRSVNINLSSDDLVDRIIASSTRAAHSENQGEVFTYMTLENYLPYLLQDV